MRMSGRETFDAGVRRRVGRHVRGLVARDGHVEAHIGGLLDCVAHRVPVGHCVVLRGAAEGGADGGVGVGGPAIGGRRHGARWPPVAAVCESARARETGAAGGAESALAYEALAAVDVGRSVDEGVGVVFVSQKTAATERTTWNGTDG